MYQFFVSPEQINDKNVIIAGADVNHIKNVLRMKPGEEIAVSNGVDNKEYRCAIESLSDDSINCTLLFVKEDGLELPAKVYLFQGLPKADKMELIIQKAVELGVYEIIPVETKRAVVKLDAKKAASKVTRWNAIAEAAAKQSKRTNIPKVESVLSYKQILEKIRDLDLFIIPYENAKGMQATKETLQSLKSGMSVGVLIGPEGGFSDNEIELAKSLNAKTVSLGKRILRTETAAITAVSMLMLYAEMNLD